jgi:hypothetical protein
MLAHTGTCTSASTKRPAALVFTDEAFDGHIEGFTTARCRRPRQALLEQEGSEAISSGGNGRHSSSSEERFSSGRQSSQGDKLSSTACSGLGDEFSAVDECERANSQVVATEGGRVDHYHECNMNPTDSALSSLLTLQMRYAHEFGGLALSGLGLGARGPIFHAGHFANTAHHFGIDPRAMVHRLMLLLSTGHTSPEVVAHAARAYGGRLPLNILHSTAPYLKIHLHAMLMSCYPPADVPLRMGSDFLFDGVHLTLIGFIATLVADAADEVYVSVPRGTVLKVPRFRVHTSQDGGANLTSSINSSAGLNAAAETDGIGSDFSVLDGVAGKTCTVATLISRWPHLCRILNNAPDSAIAEAEAVLLAENAGRDVDIPDKLSRMYFEYLNGTGVASILWISRAKGMYTSFLGQTETFMQLTGSSHSAVVKYVQHDPDRDSENGIHVLHPSNLGRRALAALTAANNKLSSYTFEGLHLRRIVTKEPGAYAANVTPQLECSACSCSAVALCGQAQSPKHIAAIADLFGSHSSNSTLRVVADIGVHQDQEDSHRTCSNTQDPFSPSLLADHESHGQRRGHSQSQPTSNVGSFSPTADPNYTRQGQPCPVGDASAASLPPAATIAGCLVNHECACCVSCGGCRYKVADELSLSSTTSGPSRKVSFVPFYAMQTMHSEFFPSGKKRMDVVYFHDTVFTRKCVPAAEVFGAAGEVPALETLLLAPALATEVRTAVRRAGKGSSGALHTLLSTVVMDTKARLLKRLSMCLAFDSDPVFLEKLRSSGSTMGSMTVLDGDFAPAFNGLSPKRLEWLRDGLASQIGISALVSVRAMLGYLVRQPVRPFVLLTGTDCSTLEFPIPAMRLAAARWAELPVGPPGLPVHLVTQHTQAWLQPGHKNNCS